jgi:glycosyltransferase involved in cell wall biosynthesis
VAEKTVGLVAPLPPQVGGVAGFAEWLLAHEEEIGRRFDAFDLWRPETGEVGGRLSLGAARIQARVLPRFLRWSRKAPRLVHYSVSHTATGLARDLLFLSLLKAGGHRVLGHMHVIPEGSSGRGRALRALDRFIDRWVTLSPTSVEALGRLGIEADWIPNPIRIAPNGHVPDSPGLGPLRLLFVGRYGQRKGCPELIAALAQARAAGTDATLRFVGREEYDGEERILREDVEQFGVGTVVEFAGVKEGAALADCYAEAQVLCLPSRREGVPLVLLEAMSFGLPVIATPVGGIADYVDHEDNGLLVPPGDIDALAVSISMLAADPELRDRLGQEGRRRIAEQAGPETIARRWREAYAELEAV